MHEMILYLIFLALEVVEWAAVTRSLMSQSGETGSRQETSYIMYICEKTHVQEKVCVYMQ